MKKVSIFNFYEDQSINNGCIIELIKNSQSIESLTFTRMNADDLKLIECLGESRRMKYF